MIGRRGGGGGIEDEERFSQIFLLRRRAREKKDSFNHGVGNAKRGKMDFADRHNQKWRRGAILPVYNLDSLGAVSNPVISVSLSFSAHVQGLKNFL